MRARTIMVTVAAALAALTCRAWAASVTDLGCGFCPTAVSADGTTVVGYDYSTGVNQAYRWTQACGMAALGYLPGGGTSLALAVSADGTVVAGCGTSTSGIQAFRWTKSGGMVGLGNLPGLDNLPGCGSEANGVSADGTVAVGMGGNMAFRWTQNGGMVGLGHLPSGICSQATAVSADGSVAVGYDQILVGNGNSVYKPFRWTQAGGMVDIGGLPGTYTGSAIGVSADGSVVVGNDIFTTTGKVEAFRWTQGGDIVGLGALPGCTESHAMGVSADGSVVVGYCDSSGMKAFIWDQTNGMQSLLSVLESDGVRMAGWSLLEAVGTSADGKIVLCVAEDPSGQSHALLADLSTNTPPISAPIPEPLTMVGAFMAIGGLGAYMRKRATSLVREN